MAQHLRVLSALQFPAPYHSEIQHPGPLRFVHVVYADTRIHTDTHIHTVTW